MSAVDHHLPRDDQLAVDEALTSPTTAATKEESNVKVMVRVRLFNKREIEKSAKKNEILRSAVKMRGKTCAIVEYTKDDKGLYIERERDAFEFDECFWSMPRDQQLSTMPIATQRDVYERSGLIAMQSAFAGYNVCIFAYGQTGSGKTYSMLGSQEDPGISPRLIDDLFANIAATPTTKSVVECTFFEIYNEKIRDLFNRKSKIGEYTQPAKIRLHPTKGVFVEGLIRQEVKTADMAKRLIERGTKERAMAETEMNPHSSRSHAIFQIQVIQNDGLKGTQRVATINLVDLAGAEKNRDTHATGSTFVEAQNINQSLSTLRRVIDTLIANSTIKTKSKKMIPPFRESVLTWVLSDSLGGNSKTMMIATISPHECNIEDTLGTLRYALRAKAIVCTARVNEEQSAELLESMRRELAEMLKAAGSKAMSGSAPSLEMKREIEMREAEVRRMESTAQEMEVALAEAHAKAEGMLVKIQEGELVRAEMSLVVAKQRQDRFATAFRNAFTISAEKKKIESTQKEFEQMQKVLQGLQAEREIMATELNASRASFDELQHATDVQKAQLFADLAQRDTLIVQLKRQASNNVEEIKYLRDQNDQFVVKVAGFNALKTEWERRLQRMQEEVLAASATIDRERSERAKAQAQFEAAIAAVKEEQENLRKRKDKYKAMFMELNAKAEASSTVISILQEDRQSIVTALKAQQQIVAEQGSSVQRIAAERKEAEAKALGLEQRLERKEEDVRCVAEALREYQSASAEWRYESHVMSRELERARASSAPQSTPSVVDVAAPFQRSPSPVRSAVRLSGSPRLSGSTPRRTQSPTAMRY